MRQFTITVAAATAFLLAACGGGGGEGPVTTGPTPLKFPLRAGADVGIEQTGGLSRLPVVGERGPIMIRHGTVNDGAGRERVTDYLGTTMSSGAKRFVSAPNVEVIGSVTARERMLVAEAVEAVNLSLPLWARMQPRPAGSNHPNTIQIEFKDCADYYDCGGSGGTAYRHGFPWITGGYIELSRGVPAHTNDAWARILLAHELLHTLGMSGHVAPDFDSIMRASSAIYASGPASILKPLDREALQALYGRLDPGDDPTDFGPWSRTSVHLAGNGFHANFGVALRNGYAEPWAHGPRPRTTLANNQALSGTVEWIGTVLGFTPATQAVSGDAQIAVDLGTLVGATTFTGLEEWASAPGAPGDGTMWGRGDLGYAIMVEGNTFRETSGDDGRLTGIFTGTSHEGVAGTLERSDLTAAFGASR